MKQVKSGKAPTVTVEAFPSQVSYFQTLGSSRPVREQAGEE
jgi:hypothetical protein